MQHAGEDSTVVYEIRNEVIPLSGVSVISTLYNYEHTIIETLDTVAAQTIKGLDVVIVDDCSSDQGAEKVVSWAEENSSIFASFKLIRHHQNQGLSTARNTAIENTLCDYVFILDADNHMLPKCAEIHKRALDENPEFAFAYSMIGEFGDSDGLMGTLRWSKGLLAHGNYIDAMAMLRKSAWQNAGGYKKLRGIGWEDFELWLNFADRGERGLWIPQVLSRYRVHDQSMLRTQTKRKDQRSLLKRELKLLYPWVRIKH